MKAYPFLALLAAVCLTACEPKNTPETPATPQEEPIPASFPKKHLIEEFTGQDCGYCPYGMDCIHKFTANDTNWIVVLHHYGYQKDNFSVAGSQTITTALGVSGAPNMAINRAKTKNGAGTSVLFHPGYLDSTKKSQFADSTYASVNISNSYDASSRTLTVKVNGIVAPEETPALQLTVLVKESGMVDYQKDYYNTYEGWKEFRHTNAVRAFLTAAKGDVIEVENHRYSAEYSVSLNSKWVPENCMVVAFLSEAFKPVVQAEQKPVVAGTQGGADIQHGGITRVPVEDYYPEPDATSGPGTFSGKQSEPMTWAQASYQTYSQYGFNYWEIAAGNTSDVVSVYNTSCVRYATIYLFTKTSETTIPLGTYTFDLSMQPGSAYAGARDDEEFYVGGSKFYFANKSYYSQGYLYPMAEWLIADGTLTITETGWEVNGHAHNGADIRLEGSTQIVNNGKAQMPMKQPKRKAQEFEYCIPE